MIVPQSAARLLSRTILAIALGSPFVASPLAAQNAAEESSERRVVLLAGFAEESALLAQLRVELLAMRFTVVVASSAPATRSAIASQMRARGANVAVVGRDDGHIEVLVSGGDSLLLTPPDDATDRIVAMRTAEQIRASLLLRESERPPEPEPESPPSVEKTPEAPDDPVLMTGVGVGYEFGRGGLGGATKGALSAHYFPWKHLGFTGLAQAPFEPLQGSFDEGDIDAWAWNLGLGLSFRQRWRDRLELLVSAGGGGGTVRVSGSAKPPDIGATEVVHPALIFGGLSLRWHVPHRVYFGLQSSGFYYLPAVRAHADDVVFAQRDFFFYPEATVGVVLF